MALSEADYGMTSQAYDGNNGRHNGDENLLVKFYLHPKLNRAKSQEEGRPIYEELPYISIMQPGNKDSIVGRKATDMDKNRFHEHWKKFEARQDDEEHVEGTLLTEWPGITRAQAEELKFFHIVTVEQLAGMSDSNAQNFRGINYLKQKATAYLEASAGNASAEALLAAEKINEELTATIAAMAARLDALEVDEE